MNIISGKHLQPFCKKASRRNREFIKHKKQYQANMHGRSNQMPTFNTFVANQSECINHEQEEKEKWCQYMRFTHPKHRSISNTIVRPINQYDLNPVQHPLHVLDVSKFGMNMQILRDNALTADIGYYFLHLSSFYLLATIDTLYTESLNINAAKYGNKGGHTKQKAKRKQPPKTSSSSSEQAPHTVFDTKAASHVQRLPNMHVFNNNNVDKDAEAGKTKVRCCILPADMIARMSGRRVFENGTILDKQAVVAAIFNDKDKRLCLEKHLCFFVNVSGGRQFPQTIDSKCQDYTLEDLKLYAMNTLFQTHPPNYFRFIIYNTASQVNKKKVVNVDDRYREDEFYTVCLCISLR